MTELDVTIMGQSYRLACKDGEEVELKRAVAFLDERMNAIREAGKIKGTDRIAVIAALGIAAELLGPRPAQGTSAGAATSEAREKITAMHAALDDALAPQEKLF